ncbi:hypothetical protein CK203_007037 [Vitis vinifera]|uniref:FAM86 N-terminal domain-containing protein n=1 Tax=Vitis vinifera TaxID=29760 RepID=A0A438KC22_VITVI|nr:hypothetical protein CK203_007037 [Vitis vinifera]
MQVEKSHVPYSKNFLKKLINEIESAHGDILDELYEQYASYMILLKVGEENSRVLKCISFLFPPGCFGVPSCPKSMQLAVPLHCSLNMLEGDTGYAFLQLHFVLQLTKANGWTNLHFADRIEEQKCICFAEILSLVVELGYNRISGKSMCSIWPSSLFLSEFILSHPEIFSNKSCFEVRYMY